MAKQEMLLNNLQKGKIYTAKQIKSYFGIAHPASAIRNLREQGYCVYSNSAVVNGAEVVKYRIGRPTRAMISLANSVIGAEAFTRAAV